MKNKTIAAIDIGGTKTIAALMGMDGTIISQQRLDTAPASGPEQASRRICASVKQLLAHTGGELAIAGVCAPGPLSRTTGRIIHIASIGWKDVAIRDMLSAGLGVPVVLENDANAAAYGEYAAGAGRGSHTMMFLTISTGIGGGCVTDGRLIHGASDSACEAGHICIRPGGVGCNCGSRGCFEAYASGTGMRRLVRADLRRGVKSSLYDMADIEEIDCLMVENAARQGDAYARSAWRREGRYLGQGIAILLQLFDFDRLVLGGGLSNALDLYQPALRVTLRRHTYAHMYDNLTISAAGLGGLAGVYGAGLLALEEAGR